MAYYGFTRDVRYVGYFETVQHQQIVVALKTAIKQGQLVALSGIVGCGKTRPCTVYKRSWDMSRTSWSRSH